MLRSVLILDFYTLSANLYKYDAEILFAKSLTLHGAYPTLSLTRNFHFISVWGEMSCRAS